MDIIEAIKTRKSIRDFKPDPVPRSLGEMSAESSQRWQLASDSIKQTGQGFV